jgi:DNA primase
LIARALPGGGRADQRYLNTTDTAPHRKGENLHGLYEQLPLLTADPTRPLLLIEGVFGLLAVLAAGTPSQPALAVPVTPSGTALTTAQAQLLAHAAGPDRPVILAFDADNAGRRAAARAWTVLGGSTPSHPGRPGPGLSCLTLPAGTDAGSLLVQHVPRRPAPAPGRHPPSPATD